MPSPTTRQATPLPAASTREDPFHLDDLEEADELVLPAENLNGGQDLEERVQNTQQRLAQLRQEAEALEQEKRQFEELSRQQKEFMQGRSEMGEKLTRALAHLDRETYEAQRRVEQLLVIKDTFNHHLDVIDSLNPEQWNPHDLRQDLGQALGMIGEAREEYVKGSSRIHLLTTGSTQGNGTPPGPAHDPAAATAVLSTRPAATTGPASGAVPDGWPLALNKETFRFWVFCGMGFTVPLAATALVLFTAWLIFR